jgi:hypothetical protein
MRSCSPALDLFFFCTGVRYDQLQRLKTHNTQWTDFQTPTDTHPHPPDTHPHTYSVALSPSYSGTRTLTQRSGASKTGEALRLDTALGRTVVISMGLHPWWY